MKLYDSYDKTLKPFIPNTPNRVIMYVCGLTPYDDAHLGHARTYISFDILKRYLIFKGYEVFHIQNITDIDDKLINRAKETGEDPIRIADHYHNRALELFNALNIIPADVYPKVSEHLSEIETIVQALMDKGYAYRTRTGIYFDISKFDRYGKLSNQSIQEIDKHRIEPDPTKRNVSDFALWKYTDDYTWDSKFGRGRPGWHIECSAMALKYSQGATLDIHGGARDLIFPHHENEIAQSECYTGRKFANFWIHTGFLTVNGEKMSKSLKNFVTIRDVLSRYDPMAVRMMFASVKYSSPIDYSEEAIQQAYQNYNTLIQFYNRIKSTDPSDINNTDNKNFLVNSIREFYNNMDNDLNTPGAMSILFSIINYFNTHPVDRISKHLILNFINQISFIFGLELKDDSKKKLDRLLESLGDYRAELRKTKRYDESDRLREVIQKADIKVYDRTDGSEYIY
ncbi:MAG: cysteine--tRNA ligase [Candidatus Anstonellales archaeon]